MLYGVYMRTGVGRISLGIIAGRTKNLTGDDAIGGVPEII
jgi:hypothetical protein